MIGVEEKKMEQTQNQYDEAEIDLRELFGAILNKIWIIIIVGILGAVIAGLYTTVFIDPQYTSSSMIFILTKTTSITSLADIQLGSQLTSDYKILTTSRPVVEKVISNLKLDMTYEELCEKISVENEADTRILTMIVTDPDPYTAKLIVDELTNIVLERVAEIMDTDEPGIVESGNIAETPSIPNLKKNCLLGGLLGILLSGGIVVVLFLLDDSIKNADDVEKYLEINVLASIPNIKDNENNNSDKKKKKIIRE